MVPDHRRPGDVDIDHFVELIKHLPKKTWLHIHCRGGSGRTTTFMAMYDMLRNANVVLFEEIIKRQAAVSPYYDLFTVNRKNVILTPYYQARLDFLRQFYRFSQDYLQGYPENWSQWKSSKIDNK